MSKGYPTPDNQVGDVTYGCIPLIVPNNSEFNGIFAAAVYGLYAEMSREYFWREQGTMSPQQAALLSSYAFALTDAYSECGDDMSCIDVADCIETSELTQNAITNLVVSEGFTPSLTNLAESPPQLPSSQLDENLLPIGYTCDNDHLFGMARFIVQNLHDGSLQLLQQLEAATNQLELLSVFSDNVEGVSYLAAPLEFILWAQDQLIEYYELAWSSSVDDELSCAIYCAIEPNCEATLNNITQAYEAAIQESFSLPLVVDVIEDIWNWLDALDYELAAGVAIVASFHWSVLKALSFGTSALGYTAGIRTFKQILSMAANDTDSDWITLCDDCPSDCTFHDYKLSVGNVGAVAGNATIVAGNGWRSIDTGATVRFTVRYDFGEVVNITEFTARFKSSGLAYGSIPSNFYANADSWVYNGGDQLLGIANWVGTQDIEVSLDFLPVEARYIYFYFDVTGTANGYVQLDSSCVSYEPIP